MRILLDENVSRVFVDVLGAAGHDVVRAQEVGLRGEPDATVLAFATAQGRVLVTSDVGLGHLGVYPLGTHAGIVVSRCTTLTPVSHATRIVAVLAELDPTALAAGSLVVADELTVRIRHKLDS